INHLCVDVGQAAVDTQTRSLRRPNNPSPNTLVAALACSACAAPDLSLTHFFLSLLAPARQCSMSSLSELDLDPGPTWASGPVVSRAHIFKLRRRLADLSGLARLAPDPLV